MKSSPLPYPGLDIFRPPIADAMIRALSRRELEVLREMIRLDGDDPTIWDALHIAESTYKTHLERIGVKLGISNAADEEGNPPDKRLRSRARTIILLKVYLRAMQLGMVAQSYEDSRA